MEAAGVPRLDVERASTPWSAAQRGALVSVGQPGGTTAGCKCSAHAVGLAEERSMRHPLLADVAPSKGSTACSGRWRIELFIRPVLKHGPRRLTCMRAGGRQTH